MSHSAALNVFMVPRFQAILCVLGAVLFWGVTPVANRYFLGSGDLALPGASYMAVRFSISSLCFLPAMLMAIKTWSLKDWGRGAFCGLTGIGAYNLLAGISGRTVSAGLAGLLNSSQSLMILVLACLIVRRLPDRRTIFAAMTGMFGILVLALSAGPAEGNVSGMIIQLVGASGWAFYCVFIPPLIAKHGAVQSSAVTMCIGTVPLLIFGWHGIGHMAHVLTISEWELLIGLSIGSSVLAMLAWNKGMAQLGAQTSGWFLYMIPIFSALGGRIFLKEPLTLGELVGGALILGSVYIAQRR